MLNANTHTQNHETSHTKNTTATLADNNAGPKITCKKSAKTLGEKKTHRKRSNGIVLDFV